MDHTQGVGSCFYPMMIVTEKLMYNDGIPGDFTQTTCGRSTQSHIRLSPGKKACIRGIIQFFPTEHHSIKHKSIQITANSVHQLQNK